jgi:hypothetical protein
MRWQFAGILAVCVGLLGCRGEENKDLTNVVQPTGKVLLASGEPAKGTKVDFAPTSPDTVAAYGIAKADGTFTFVTRGGQAGIVPGTYKVTATPSPMEGTPAEDVAFARKTVPEVNEQEVTVAAGATEVVVKLPAGRPAPAQPVTRPASNPSAP